MYYQQIRDITNTLQKELQTKEELASELRDAYEKLRNSAKVGSLCRCSQLLEMGRGKTSSNVNQKLQLSFSFCQKSVGAGVHANDGR